MFWCILSLESLLTLSLFLAVVQNYIRKQDHSKTNYNLVHETLQFLDCICGSTSGGLGLLGLYINESNVGLINQCLESLTEYCQGPCHENQVRDSGYATITVKEVVWLSIAQPWCFVELAKLPHFVPV